MDRLEDHLRNMTVVGTKTDEDLRVVFDKVYEGVKERHKKLCNPVCHWNDCKMTCSDVEELYRYSKFAHQSCRQDKSCSFQLKICMLMARMQQNF